jgi:hypothetical protein
MSIPGFTAESSMGFRKTFVGSIPRKRTVHLNAGISPAAIDTSGECISRCAGDPECSFLCQTSGDIGGDGGAGGGGGGGTRHCNAGCGPCQQIGGRWQRSCMQANCNVHLVACAPPRG